MASNSSLSLLNTSLFDRPSAIKLIRSFISRELTMVILCMFMIPATPRSSFNPPSTDPAVLSYPRLQVFTHSHTYKNFVSFRSFLVSTLKFVFLFSSPYMTPSTCLSFPAQITNWQSSTPSCNTFILSSGP